MFPEDFPSDLPLIFLRTPINTSKPQQGPFPYLPSAGDAWQAFPNCDTLFLKKPKLQICSSER